MRKAPLVLLVEDDPVIRSVLTIALEMEGYRVLTAPGATAALALLRLHQPAVILLDVLLPVMDGWHFLSTYRTMPPPHAAVVVLTAATDAQPQVAEAGAVQWVGKPFDMDELLRVVHHLVHARPEARSLETHALPASSPESA